MITNAQAEKSMIMKRQKPTFISFKNSGIITLMSSPASIIKIIYRNTIIFYPSPFFVNIK